MVKGVGRRFGHAVITRAGIDASKRAGSLSPEEIERLVQVRPRCVRERCMAQYAPRVIFLRTAVSGDFIGAGCVVPVAAFLSLWKLARAVPGLET